MKPTLGRIVIYHHGTYGDLPAIVSALNSDEGPNPTLHGFTPFGVVMFFNAEEGPGERQWSWPERVPA